VPAVAELVEERDDFDRLESAPQRLKQAAVKFGTGQERRTSGAKQAAEKLGFGLAGDFYPQDKPCHLCCPLAE
jgi:hypothetical protein